MHIGDNNSGLRANGNGNLVVYINKTKVKNWSNISLYWLVNANVDNTIIIPHQFAYLMEGGGIPVY
ncbi:MAG: hypothetical protein ACTS8H_03470 [Arsenophonus sp. NC-PE1-MAG3]